MNKSYGSKTAPMIKTTHHQEDLDDPVMPELGLDALLDKLRSATNFSNTLLVRAYQFNERLYGPSLSDAGDGTEKSTNQYGVLDYLNIEVRALIDNLHNLDYEMNRITSL